MTVLGSHKKNYDNNNLSRVLINGNFRRATVQLNSRDQWKG